MAVDRTLVQIRERTFFDILDLSLIVVRRRARSLALAGLLGCLPFVLLNTWLIRSVGLSSYFYIILVIWEAPWATAPITLVLGGLMFGQRPRAGQVWKSLAGSLPAMIVYQGLLRGICVVVPFLIVLIPVRLNFVNEVVLLERGRLRTVYERSAAITGDRASELFGRAMLQVGFTLLFTLGFWWACEVFGALLFSGWRWEDEIPYPKLHDASVRVALWLSIVFFSVVRFLSYIDQRIRLEGWEVELRLRQVGAAMEDTERW